MNVQSDNGIQGTTLELRGVPGMNVQQKIQHWLDAHHKMSQTAFAELCDVPQSRINDLMRGAELSMKLARPIAKRMGVSIDWLVDDAQGWPPPEPGLVAAAGLQLSVTEQAIILALRKLAGPGQDWATIYLADVISRLAPSIYQTPAATPMLPRAADFADADEETPAPVEQESRGRKKGSAG